VIISGMVSAISRVIKQALIPRNPRQIARMTTVWGIRIVVSLAVVIAIWYTVTVLVAHFLRLEKQEVSASVWNYFIGHVALVSALVALAGVLATQVVTAYIARSTQRHQQEIEDRRSRAELLQAYIDQMGKLPITTYQIGIPNPSSKPNNSDIVDDGFDTVHAVARAQTLAILQGLKNDSTRKGTVLVFLYESKLIDKTGPVVKLQNADLSEVYLWGADLREADLSWANLYRARLWSTNLMNANLQGCYFGSATFIMSILIRADLSRAYLSDANLTTARLDGANLTGAQMYKTDFKGADLDMANLSAVDLRFAKNLTQDQINKANGDENTRLPNGLQRPTHWPDASESKGPLYKERREWYFWDRIRQD
jgi:uncharacterized protein YjbI with pentapeptide repeats